MHIGFDGYFLDARPRGMGKFAAQQLSWLAKADLCQEITCWLPTGRPLPDPLPNVTVSRLNVAPVPIWEQVFLPIAIRRAAVDIMICPYNTGPLAVPASVRSVVVVHDTIFMRGLADLPLSSSIRSNCGRGYRRLVAPRAAKRASLVLTRTETVRREIAELWRITRQNIEAIPGPGGLEWNPGAVPGFKALREKHRVGEQYVLVIGGDAPHKNMDRLVKAWESSSAPVQGFQLVVLGVRRGPRKGWEEAIATGGVVLLPYVTEAELSGLLAKATALIMPSLEEGLGMPVLEAATFGIPLILSDIAVFRELADGEATFFDPLSVLSIRGAIQRVVNSPELRARLRNSARNVSRKYSEERAARTYLAAIERLHK